VPIQKWSESIWLVQIADEPGITEDLMSLRESLAEAEPVPQVVLDLSAIQQINSSNLSQILRLRKQTIDRDTRLIIAGLPDSVWAVFMTTGLDKIFDFAPDVMTALATLQIDRGEA
jgi:anti-anti-sigma factor